MNPETKGNTTARYLPWTIAFLGITEASALVVFGWADSLAFPTPRLGVLALGVIAYLAAGYIALRGLNSIPSQTVPQEARPDHSPLWIPGIFLVGTAIRLALLPLTPELSDDIYRYLWDGHVQASGLSPYKFPPNDPALVAIRTPWHSLINHPEVSTIYPPVSQFAFLLTAWFGGAVLSAKALWIAFDLATGAMLVSIARKTKRSPIPVLIWYLWCPLLIVEVSWSGHFEPLGLFFMTALLLVETSTSSYTRKGIRLGALLGLSALTKFAPAAAFPALVRRYGWRAGAAFCVACFVLYAPYALVGLDPLTKGLRTYSEHWTANEGAFLLFSGTLRDPQLARMAAASVVVAVAGYTWFRRMGLEAALFWTLGAGILLSPTVHPWYVLWVLPFAALRSNPAFLSLTVTAFFGYWGLAEFQISGDWPLPLWVRLCFWVPVWGLLGLLLRLKLLQLDRGKGHTRRQNPKATA